MASLMYCARITCASSLLVGEHWHPGPIAGENTKKKYRKREEKPSAVNAHLLVFALTRLHGRAAVRTHARRLVRTVAAITHAVINA